MVEILVPIALFAIVPVIVFIVSFNGRKRATDLQATVQKAIEKGVELNPDTIKALGIKPRSPYGDLRWGTILIAIAAAFVVLGFSIQGIDDDPEAFQAMMGVAAFPGFIGVALLGMHFMLKGKNRDDQE
jgi:hypothetical protein